MNTTDYIEDLNEAQSAAVLAPLGNTLVLAGAGSGKTRVLVSRIAWLVHTQNIPLNAIFAVTFTNKAAAEMKTRLHALLNRSLSDLWVGTFHSLCHRFLRRHYREANLPSQFHIMDTDDQGRMIKRVLASLNLDEAKWPIKQVQSFINGKKDEGLRANHVGQPAYPQMRTMIQIYQTYEQSCQAAGVIDFAELLLRVYELLKNHPPLLAHYQERFSAILIDEFQDTNAIQYAFIRLLSTPKTSVMAVGDDDQSIYGWRGARVENIQRFNQDFPNTITIRLEQNYRSTANILNAANHLINHNQTRMGKNLWTKDAQGEKILVFAAINELEEARFVSEQVLKRRNQGYMLSEMAVLYRSNAQSRVLEEALLRAGIAYRIHGGVRFFERAEIKDAIAYLRLITYHDDNTAFERIVNFPARGIGDKTLDFIRETASHENISLWQAACQIINENQLTARAQRALENFIQLIETMRSQLIERPLENLIQVVIQDSGLHAHFSAMRSDEAASRLDNLQELINAGRQYESEQSRDESVPLLTAFLAHVSLEGAEMADQAKSSGVHLMTLHSAKGLEFPVVFMVGMEEGLFPSRQSMDEPSRLQEERRLCYVGMTRAEKQLILTYAKIRRQYGREENHRPSRFLRELPESVLTAPHDFNPRSSTTRYMEPTHESGIKIGQTVQHAKFGKGTVLALEGSGAHTRVQVNFETDGTKWLVLAYANLQSVR